ncbi:NTP transferase domain-containing protein [Salegentibacter sp. JZCK2]|uniref:mannose-1-phosphate guanylyltransferase n=1 Tax=Salegentibacter tibetensis TaxID=2873600 RepID=UPI001CCA2DCC|nr:sugar phosphate nucleotidyltransferase [Salegentibacter tibetensis]MBZ9728685.1 NTP transferase domain-containing protein [Salegentibacter tibetensis]
MSSIKHVLLTGGVGSRLWPLSRKSRPKQYLEIFSENSLFELAVQRNLQFCEELYVVGNKGNRHLSEASLKKAGITEYIDIVEATPRNTAPAIAFAAFAAQPEDILLVTPADHIIISGPAYTEAIEEAINLAKENNLVTFGIKPNRPETGYGYIEHKDGNVLSFREKPNEETAKEFLKKGNFLWNSGMFCFKAGVFLEELEKYSPKVYKRSLLAWKKAKDYKLEEESSFEIPAISVDYAVLEKSDKIKVVPSHFEWSDMGSFEAVYDYLKAQGHPVDDNDNMQIGSEKPVFFTGLKNSILVNTDDAILVLQKEASQQVKDIYQELEKNQPELVG